MTDQKTPHDKPEPDDAESIIELTDVVASPGAPNDDIIELTDVVERNADTEEEPVIELTDVVELKADAEEEPVIELTDVVESAPAEEPAVDPVAEVESSPAEEPVIEPVEAAATADDNLEAMIADASVEAPAEEIPVESVEESTSGEMTFAEMELDLDKEHSDDGLFDSMEMNLEADLLPSSDDPGELDFNLSTQELSDAIDLLDAKLAEEPPQPPAVEEAGVEPVASVGSDQLEAALENVIKKMMGDKLDQLLNDAIEKTVSAEITRLKEELLGDNPEKS